MVDADDKLLDHDYDGIKELDNELPTWWLMILYGSIAFAAVYMLWYHILGIGYLQVDEYKKEMDPSYVRVRPPDEAILGIFTSYHQPYYNPAGDMTPWKEEQGIDKPAFVMLDRESDTTTYTLLTDAEDLDKGKAIFQKSCATCHGKFGEGGVGPNLTDNYWLHGGKFTDIVKTIQYGVPAKGMISWRGYLKPEEILEAASYIHSLHATNPPNPKAPQGELVSE